MAISTIDTSSISALGYGFKNRIINGAMMIDQRNNGASVSASAASQTTYTLDRWYYYATQASKFTVQQNAASVTPPAGFTKYLGITSSSAYSVGSGDLFEIAQAIEGFNAADLGWGTVNAKAVTISFQVYSSLTGTFGGSVCNGSFNRTYPFSYTVSSANTWTPVYVTIAGDTAGTWATDNSAGLHIRFGLGSGSTFSGTSGAWAAGNYVQPTSTVSVVGTNGATFYITGVQLEKGVKATDFDYRPYGTELALCQRYYQRVTATPLGYSLNTSVLYGGSLSLKATMRSSPTLDASGNSFIPQAGSAGTVALLNASPDAVQVYNSAANWSSPVWQNLSAGFTSEL